MGRVKEIFVIFLIGVNLSGCSKIPKIRTEEKREVLSEEECLKAPKYWYGKQGQNPSNNDLWKCFDWELKIIND